MAAAWKVTRGEVLHLVGKHKDNRLAEYPLTPVLELNLYRLLVSVNKVRDAYGKPLYPSSGYRPLPYNIKAGGSKSSLHMVCLAVDFEDPTGEFAKWCLANVKFLKECGLQLEDPRYTKGWVHLDLGTRPRTVFIPY